MPGDSDRTLGVMTLGDILSRLFPTSDNETAKPGSRQSTLPLTT